MNIVDKSELPKDYWIEQQERIEATLKRIRQANIQKLLGIEPQVFFKEFWLLCEQPKPILFKYGNRYLITRDKTRIKGGEMNMAKGESKMVFADVSSLPAKKGGKMGEDWFKIFSQIPVGKMWIPEGVKTPTLREALKAMIEAKKVKEDEFEITQRTIDGKVKVYVIHNQ